MNSKTQNHSKPPLANLPSGNHIISDADRAICLGSDELKPCPFCGCNAISAGTKNEQTGNALYQVICTAHCGATVHVCQKDPEQARREAVAAWNLRIPFALLYKACEQKKQERDGALNELAIIRNEVSRFLIAHRDVARCWIEAFVECGAVEADFNYHPRYPFIKPKGGAS